MIKTSPECRSKTLGYCTSTGHPTVARATRPVGSVQRVAGEVHQPGRSGKPKPGLGDDADVVKSVKMLC